MGVLRTGVAIGSLCLSCQLTTVVALCGGTEPRAPELTDLTRCAWRRDVSSGPQLPPESTTWSFYPEGTFRRVLASDQEQIYVGAWSAAIGPSGNGVLFLSGVVDERFPRLDAMSFEVAGDALRLAELRFETVRTLDEKAPAVEPAHVRAVEGERRATAFSLWTELTRVSWRKAGGAAPEEPGRLELGRNGLYVARFTPTGCSYEGTWSLLGMTDRAGELRMSVPKHSCDPRGPREGFVRQLSVSFSGDALVLGELRYVPEPR